MYELVLVENGIYEGKKAGKVIIIFLENPFLIIFNENSRPGGGWQGRPVYGQAHGP